MSFPGPRAYRHDQHRLWNGQSLHCQPGFGWNTPSLDRVQHLGDQPEEPEVGSAVFTERQRPDGAMALVVFDVFHLDGRSVMRQPCRDRRKRLEDLVEGRQLPRIAGEHKSCCSPRPEPPSMAVVGCWQLLQRDFAREGLCRYGGEPTPSLGSLPERTDLLHGCYMERRLERTGAEASGPLSRAPQKPHSAVRLMSPAA